MSFYDAIRVGASGAAGTYTVDRSLRFNYTEYLTRTPSSTGNQKVWTWSAWIKRTEIGSKDYIYSANDGGSGYFALYFKDDNLYSYFDPGNNYGSVSDREFRDVGAWFHIVHQVDALNTTQRIWINGTEMSLNSSRNPSNSNFPMNESGITLYIGKASWKSEYNNMYLAEVHYSDGYKYQASDFAETDSETGQWVPKSPSITYGTNGFYLNFSDNSGTTATTLGKDNSGNSNNFTPNNFEVSTGVGNDSVPDTPTNNFPTLNPLYNPVNTTFGEGNLLMRGGDNFAASTFLLPKSGKWYAEFTKYNNGAIQSISVTRANTAMTNYAGYLGLADNVEYVSNGEVGNRTRGSTSDATAWTDDAGVVVAVAVDMDNGAVYFARNNTYINSGVPTSGSSKTGAIATDLLTDNNGDHVIAVHGYNGSNSYGMYANFGQQPFTYTPPTGYKVLSSANLPDPTILLASKHFNTLIWDGNSTQDRDISGLDFQPDWVWIKARNGDAYGGGLYYHHVVWDSLRGVGSNTIGSASRKELTVNEAYVEGRGANYTDYYGHVSAFNSDGFELDHVTGEPPLYVNRNTNTYVGWSWNAGETDGATYRVVVVSDSGNKYRFRNSANTATFAQSAVTLDLAEGGTYIFNMDDSTNASHPFSIGTAANGTVYTTGITYFLDGVSKTYSEYTSGFAAATTRRLHITVPASAPQLYYWCSIHSGMGGAINTNTTLGSSNFDGTVQSTAKVNASAGFSIVTLNGTGSVLTFGHGLGVKPNAVILKARNIANNWLVFHQGYGATKTLFLDNTNATSTNAQWYNDTEPTSTVFTLGTWSGMNTSTPSTIVAYCFSEVAGYSKFGTYTGNGNANGTFVFIGFRPAWVMIKMSSGSNSWVIYDNKRSPINLVDKRLRAQGSFAEDTHNGVDFLSNGFKTRNASSTSTNQNGATYIYFAFAEAPFKNSRAR